MITFNDVRRTNKTTFTFFPDGLADEVRHFMALAGITKQQYEILSYPDTQARYPNLDIPAVPFDPRLKDVRSTYCRTPNLIISNMNPDDLQRKIYEIHLSAEGYAWREKQAQDLVKAVTEATGHPAKQDKRE